MPHTVMPRARAASRSIEALARPVVTMSRRAGQPLDHGSRERRALAHQHHHVVRRQPGDQALRVRLVVVEHVDLGDARHRAPVGGAQGDPLVVVEDGNAHASTSRTDEIMEGG